MGTYNIYIYGVGGGERGPRVQMGTYNIYMFIGGRGGGGEGASGANGNLQHIHVYEELEKII